MLPSREAKLASEPPQAQILALQRASGDTAMVRLDVSEPASYVSQPDVKSLGEAKRSVSASQARCLAVTYARRSPVPQTPFSC